jgi:hypothetical protein
MARVWSGSCKPCSEEQALAVITALGELELTGKCRIDNDMREDMQWVWILGCRGLSLERVVAHIMA